jgi:hypothetical protein
LPGSGKARAYIDEVPWADRPARGELRHLSRRVMAEDEAIENDCEMRELPATERLVGCPVLMHEVRGRYNIAKHD